MSGGIHGKILHVDLSTTRTWIEQPPEDVYRLLLGGRGLITWLLLRDLPPHADPLGPDNLLIFAPGVLQGTTFPGSGRHGVGGRSPLTGALGSSEVGGYWGYEFKRTGWDALVIHGRAASPIYLSIRDEQVEFRPADHLWGQNTAPVQAAIRRELGDERVRVAQIGPAGENMVLYAAIMHDINRAAGRNGLGAVMGSKNLKAVAVRGTQRVSVSDPARLQEVTRWFHDNYKSMMASFGADGQGRGTQDNLVGLALNGGLPTRNFGQARFENADLLSGERNYAMFLQERDTCYACPVRCKQVFAHTEPGRPDRSIDPAYGGAEYETMAAFGPNCDVHDNVAVNKANELCNAYGLDTISTGATIAFVIECFENGLITTQDTGGMAFCWGDGDAVIRTVEMIAHREGFGDAMAQGVARLSAQWGPATQPFNLTIKGQELPMHEPRLKAGLGLGYAVSPIGAEHMTSMHDTGFMSMGRGINRVNLVANPPVSPADPHVLDENKLRIFYYESNWKHFLDCAVLCHFYFYDYRWMAEAISAVTGVEYGVSDVQAIGARAQTLARLFNLREGFTAADDRLPQRVMTAFDEGPLTGVEIAAQDFERAKHRWYEMMQWDTDSGRPTPACLQSLGLDRLIGQSGDIE